MSAASTSGMILGKRYASHTMIYGVGVIARSMASFALLPIYTSYLAPKDYGVIELLTMLIDFSAIFFGARIGQGFMRYYGLSESEKEKATVLGSAYGMVALTHLLGAALLIVFSSGLSHLLLGDAEYSGILAIFALTLLFGGLLEIPFAFLRAESRAGMVLALSLTKLGMQIGLNMIFLVALDMGVLGVAYASVLAQIIMVCLVTAIVSRHTAMHFSRAMVRKLIGFTLPIILAAVSMFVITYGDRYFIRLHMDLDSVGIYALAYKFGFMLFALGWQPFLTMWDPERYKLVKDEANHHMFRNVFSIVSVIVVYVAFGISVWVRPVLELMSDPSFWSAADYVPIVLLAYVFLAWTSFSNLGLFVSGKTRYFGLITMATALVCVAGYYVFIPRYGLYAAASVTAAVFFVRFLAIHIFATREFDMKLDWFPPVMALVIAGLLLWALHAPGWQDVPHMARAFVLSVAFPVLCVVLKVVPLTKAIRTVRGLITKNPVQAGS